RDSHIEVPHGLSYLNYLDYRGLSQVFDEVISRAEWPIAMSWNHGNRTERLWVEMVTGNYFSMLGVPAARGRGFVPGEERAPVLPLTWDCWQRRFGGDPGVLGSTVRLNGRAFTIIGVTQAAGVESQHLKDCRSQLDCRSHLGGFDKAGHSTG